MKLNAIQNSSIHQRRARTRSLIQLGGLLEPAKTLEVFNIPLGTDLQTDPSIKNNIAALFKSFLIINEMITSKELDLNVLALQGLEAFKQKGLSELRPLDRKKDYELQTYSANQNDKQNKLKEQPITTTEEKM
jgi:hypothetical protein